MARGVNKVILVGNLGKDPETSYTPSGQSVCKFSLATSRSYKDKTGELKEETEWHNIVAWGRTGEICQQYLTKGRPAFIEGRIQTRSWEDKEGKKRYTTEIIASNMQLMDSKAGSGSGNSSSFDQMGDAPVDAGFSGSAQSSAPHASTAAHAKAPVPAMATEAAFDDDIPF